MTLLSSLGPMNGYTLCCVVMVTNSSLVVWALPYQSLHCSSCTFPFRIKVCLLQPTPHTRMWLHHLGINDLSPSSSQHQYIALLWSPAKDSGHHPPSFHYDMHSPPSSRRYSFLTSTLSQCTALRRLSSCCPCLIKMAEQTLLQDYHKLKNFQFLYNFTCATNWHKCHYTCLIIIAVHTYFLFALLLIIS